MHPTPPPHGVVVCPLCASCVFVSTKTPRLLEWVVYDPMDVTPGQLVRQVEIPAGEELWCAMCARMLATWYEGDAAWTYRPLRRSDGSLLHWSPTLQ